jgi:antitoxin VapB
MALIIKSAEAERLTRELAAHTGEGITEAVIIALRERLERTKRRPTVLKDEITRIGSECAALPELNPCAADEILAYGSDGLPH